MKYQRGDTMQKIALLLLVLLLNIAFWVPVELSVRLGDALFDYTPIQESIVRVNSHIAAIILSFILAGELLYD